MKPWIVLTAIIALTLKTVDSGSIQQQHYQQQPYQQDFQQQQQQYFQQQRYLQEQQQQQFQRHNQHPTDSEEGYFYPVPMVGDRGNIPFTFEPAKPSPPLLAGGISGPAQECGNPEEVRDPNGRCRPTVS